MSEERSNHGNYDSDKENITPYRTQHLIMSSYSKWDPILIIAICLIARNVFRTKPGNIFIALKFSPDTSTLSHSHRSHWLVTGQKSVETAKFRSRRRHKSLFSNIFQNLSLSSDDFPFIKALLNFQYHNRESCLVLSSVTLLAC